MSGRINGVSMERLVIMMNKLGRDVEIHIKKKFSTCAKTRLRVHVALKFIALHNNPNVLNEVFPFLLTTM